MVLKPTRAKQDERISTSLRLCVKNKKKGYPIWPLLMVALVLVVYAQTIGFGFLRFDDPDYTFACPFVKDGLSWKNMVEAFRNVHHGAVWMPLTWISYMTDISLFGRGASGHHLVNVVLHLANTLLLLRLVCSMMARFGDSSDSSCSRDSSCFRDIRDSSDSRFSRGSSDSSISSFSRKRSILKIVVLLAVLFWALHPQRVEVVAWVASRKELLWAFFTLVGLLAWRSGKSLVTLVCCALACMSKPTAMVFPLLAMVVGGLRPLKPLTALKPLMALTPLKPLMALTVMFAISLATGALAIYSQTHPEGMVAKELFYAPLGERLLNAMVAVGLYLAQMVVPVGIHLDYRVVPGGWPLNGTLGLSVFVAVLVGIVWLVWRGSRFSRTSSVSSESQTLRKIFDSIVIRAILFFAVALLPTLGLFGSFGEHARADRFLYVPAMAAPLFVAGWISGVSRSSSASRLSRIAFCGLLVLLSIFAIISFRLASTYRDDLSAFSRTLACDPLHWRALAHVGEAECAANDLDAGIDHLRFSRKVYPRETTDGKLAYALMRRGRSADWDEIRAICAPYAADPSRDAKGQALEALGTAELKARDWPNAALHLSRSIMAPARFYSSADAKLKLAYAWHNAGRRTDARKLFEAISRSTRADLSAKADEVLSVLDRSPTALLFW